MANEQFTKKGSLPKSSFEFTNENKKIHDQAFESASTTFAKDAFKRFCKNKASVTGAIIIGVLMLFSFIEPPLSGININENHAEQSLLDPKLFEAGTGFWDGCNSYSEISWDPDTQLPVGFESRAIVPGTLRQDKTVLTNTPSPYARGGYLRFTNEIDMSYYDDMYSGDAVVFFENFHPIKFTKDDGVVASIDFGNVDNISSDVDGLIPGKLGEYRVSLVKSFYNKSTKKYKETSTSYMIKDWCKEWGIVNLNLSQILAENEVEGEFEGYLKFELCGSKTAQTYVLIKTLKLQSSNSEVQARISKIDINDANLSSYYSKDNSGSAPEGYWQSEATKNLYEATLYKCSFTYDPYEEKLGTMDFNNYGFSKLQNLKEKGWCSFDDNDVVGTFQVINKELCPVNKVYSENEVRDNVRTFAVNYTKWKDLGYSKMPKYIFGTNSNGIDLFTVACSSLKTSLLVAVISSAICFAIGLVWGSFSGYFGGTVDLVMERITDIISGIPWIVMMTLIIIVRQDRGIITFAIALCMTGWIGTSGTVRTQFYRFKGREYVLASRTLGSSDVRLIFKHILPNALGTIVTSSVLMIPSCIFSESTLAYLGLGLKGVASFGVLLSDNQVYLSSHPALICVPAVIISLLMISFNLFGNGLRDALNPSLKGGE